MKTLLLLITLFAFLQSAFLPVNLVLVLIVARGLILDDRSNLFIAFFGGLILSFLLQVNMAYYPLEFILVVKLGALIKKLPVSFNLLMTVFSGAVLIGLGTIIDLFVMQKEFSVEVFAAEIILVVPFYYLMRFWEERMIAATHTKLKIGGR